MCSVGGCVWVSVCQCYHSNLTSARPSILPLGCQGDTKRKTLPLWLREALEKMERDKQKKQEKEVKLSAKEGGSATGEEEGGKLSWKAELEMDEEREEEREEAGGRAWRSYRYELAKAKKEVGHLS